MNYYSIFLRSIVAFLALFILARLMGKRQIGQVSFFNYVAGVTVGSIAATISVDASLPIGQGTLSLFLWGLLAVGMAYVLMEWRQSRGILNGEPAIVIKRGVIQPEVLARLRLPMDELNMLLRRNKVFDITDVEYAVFETDGKLSVLKKPELQNVTRKDMNLPAPALKYLPSKLVVEGRVVDENLQKANLDRNWLEENIKAQGYRGLHDVFYAELLTDGSVFVNPDVNHQEES